MRNAEMGMRDRLAEAGLAHHADALLELALPAIKLRSEGEPAGQVLGRPPAPLWGLAGGVSQIAGGGCRFALREDGTVAAWGYNERGQLGDGTTKFRRTPVTVHDLTDVVAVSSGVGHCLALTASGQVFAWGSNRNGQVGDGTLTDRHTPTAVKGLEGDVVALAAGENVSLALTSGGSVFGWGANPCIELRPEQLTPVRCLAADAVVAIAAGGSERLALTAEGLVLAWGSSPSDLSGTGGVVGPARWGRPPQTVEGLAGAVKAIAAGYDHSLALTAEGSVFAWGSGHLGQLGDGSGENRYPPVRVSGLGTGVRAIAAGRGCSYALTADGAVLSWGWNFEGALGDGGVTREQPNDVVRTRMTPGPVPALGSAVAAVAQFVALMEDGSVRGWGGEYEPDERGPDAHLELAATKLGGRPDLRARSRWPARDGRPLAFVAQLDLMQLAPLDRSGVLPRAGLLSFFYGDPARPLEPDVCEVILTEPGAPLIRRDFPEELADHQRSRAVALRAEAELALPPAPPPFLSAKEQEIYQWELDELIPGPRHRVLGHPDPVQSDPRESAQSLLLLQVDSDDTARMMWGDVGRLSYLIHEDDLRAQRFEAVRCELQSH